MATNLFYNGVKILEGQPTPFVSRADGMVKYGERWAESVNIALEGQITGCPSNFEGLIEEQKALINIFSQDFGKFEIYDDSVLIFEAPNCLIKNGLKFGSSRYNSAIGYSVELEFYPQDLFLGTFGVLDPQDEWSFTENDDKTFSATHIVGAKGFNTTSGASNALQNAISFVSSRTGNFSSADPFFVNVPSGWAACPKTVRESKNRFNGTYSVSTTYEGDTLDSQSSILRYSTSVDCDSTQGFLTASIKGKIQGCSLASISDVRNRYTSLDILDCIYDSAGADIHSSLNPIPISSGIKENAFVPSLDFDITYDNFTGSGPVFDYVANVNSGHSDIITIQIDGTLRYRGSNSNRWSALLLEYPNINLVDYGAAAYSEFGGLGQLNEIPTSTGISFNKFASEIKLSAEFNDKTLPVSGFSDFDYKLIFGPSLQRVSVKPLLANQNGALFGNNYYLTDLGYKNRCDFSIQGNGVLACGYNVSTCINNLKAFANSTFAANCPSSKAILEQKVITTGTNSISFSFGWSAASANNVVVPRSDYQAVSELSLI